MKTIEYAKDGQPIGDYQALLKAQEFLSSDLNYIKIGSEIFIQAIRVLIREGKYPHNKISFFFEGIPILLDQDGRPLNYPEGFCSVTDDLLDRLLT